MSSDTSSSEKTKRSKNPAKKQDEGVLARLKGFLYPDWAKEGVKSSRAWKTFARCMIALFCTMVLLVDNNCECRVAATAENVC
jgi:hypothetical protein